MRPDRNRYPLRRWLTRASGVRGLSILAAMFAIAACKPSQRDAAPASVPRLQRGDIVLLGDSLTFEGDWDKLLPGCRVINLGVRGDLVERIAKRVPEFGEVKVRAIFVMAGTNDVNRSRNLDKSLQIYRAMVDQIKPNAEHVYVQQIPKVSPAHEDSVRFNAGASRWNAGLARVAEETGSVLVDVGLDEPNLVIYRTADGMHLTPPAYETWARKIRSLVNCETRR